MRTEWHALMSGKTNVGFSLFQVRVAQNLADMIGEQTELTAAILDALGDLNLPAAKAAQVPIRSPIVSLADLRNR